MHRVTGSTFAFLALLCCVGAASTPSTPSQAQPWPQRSVRLIVPIGSGTAADVAARLFAEKLGERWGRPVIVENRPGGDGITGVAAFAGLNDDHTLLFAQSSPVTLQPAIHDRLPYDPVRDLVPISTASDIFIAIAVSHAMRAGSIAEFVDEARAQPGKLNWAAGPGLPQHVFAAFLRNAGLDLTSLSYREVAPAQQDLGSGRISALVHSLAAALPVVQAGKARLLAIANSQRASIAPNVPTALEAGFPELRMDGFCGFYGWRGISDDLRRSIAADVGAIARDPAVSDKLAKTGQVVRASTPEEFAAALQAQRDRMAAIAAELGLKAPQ
jgi:tripartite-type tricarboxylate transporter receptor subunit TctC